MNKQLATINRKLKKIETRMEDNQIKAWYENGLLLWQIQEQRLYKNKYSNFDDYTKKRWEMSKQHASNLINASKTFQILEKNVNQSDVLVDGILPKNESQIRPLLKLSEPSERVYVWNHLVESEIKPTRESVTDAVNEFQAHPLSTEAILEEIDYIDVEVATARLHTGDNESYTPIQYLESVKTVMGVINVDPASNDYANERVKAEIYYTEATNGLDKEWNGKVWMNPPYASALIKQFIAKLLEEIDAGRCTEAIMLTNNSADTLWFHDSARASKAVCFTKGRINFYKADDSTTSPTNGQTFFYFGDNVEAFTEEFKQYGMIVEVLADAT